MTRLAPARRSKQRALIFAVDLISSAFIGTIVNQRQRTTFPRKSATAASRDFFAIPDRDEHHPDSYLPSPHFQLGRRNILVSGCRRAPCSRSVPSPSASRFSGICTRERYSTRGYGDGLRRKCAASPQTKEERREVAIVIAILAKIGIAALAALLWAGRNPDLWLIGAAAGAAFAGQTLLKKLARRTRMLSEIVGTTGLTSAAPAAYYVMTGKFGATAWMLWLANLIFAGNQIHYVQLRIHTAKIEGLGAIVAGPSPSDRP